MIASTVRWGDVPTWLAAVGTIGAVIVALVLAGREGRQRREAAKKAQADQVTAWLGPSLPRSTEEGPSRRLEIRNNAALPVYKFIASYVLVGASQGAGIHREHPGQYRIFFALVPAGETTAELKIGGAPGALARTGVEIAFRDAGGRSWLRSVDGRLRELSVSPEEHYGIPEPVPWDDRAGQ